ncbi:MAG TPA: ABC transporter permease subunit [Acidimicrobiia bacterium]|nr:ABC transporter permease subunit [Acidimicrobiia bacterium]
MVALKERSLQLLSLVVAVLIWEIVARAVDLSSAIPSPLVVFESLWNLVTSGKAWGPLTATIARTLMGFLLGFVAGVAYGVTVYAKPIVGDYSRGIFNTAMFAPTLIIIFLGLVMFGLSNLTVVLIVGFVISTDVGVYMRDAFQNFDEELAAMARSYKAKFIQRVRDVYFPFLVPPMLAAGRIGFSLAWKVAFLCEVFGFPNGLGWEVRASYRIYDMTGLLAWLLVFIITLLVVEQVIRASEKALVRW